VRQIVLQNGVLEMRLTGVALHIDSPVAVSEGITRSSNIARNIDEVIALRAAPRQAMRDRATAGNPSLIN
jgi:hypothetical protein